MRIYFFLLLLFQLTASCAPLTKQPEHDNLLAYIPQQVTGTPLSDFQPTFLIEKPDKLYNRIGTPKAELLQEGDEYIYIEVNEPTIFTETRSFTTPNAEYTNLIYRVHFPETPFSLLPFQLAAGKNVGLIIIITLNRQNQPVLYTTVHTCGCYLAFIPTTFLPINAYPPGWPETKQVIFSETLPAVIDLKGTSINNSVATFLISDASHRIKNIWLTSYSKVRKYQTVTLNQEPLSSLEQLPLNGTSYSTSFYETTGNRTGYVKGSSKILERLLMSWWAFDWNIGEDKKLSPDTLSPPIFFTSLKPWARTESDLRNFPAFLKYWGWKL